MTPGSPPGSPAKVQHNPDSPFGCLFSWGPSIRVLPDMGWHVCNLPYGHVDWVQHVCKCGEVFVYETSVWPTKPPGDST